MRLWQRLAAKQGGATDPDFANVSLLMHFDGADESTTFTEETGKTASVFGDAQIDTAVSKFGGASGLFDGSGDYISFGKDAGFEFGSGDFTIEMWVNIDSITATQALVYYGQPGATASTGYAFSLAQAASSSGNGLVFTSNNNVGGQANTISNDDLTINTWQFIQVARDSGTLKIYLDGTEIASGLDPITHNVTAGHELLIARRGTFSISYYAGHIDDARITKGVARANTVPTSAFPNS